jgi:hypothetical protein
MELLQILNDIMDKKIPRELPMHYWNTVFFFFFDNPVLSAQT